MSTPTADIAALVDQRFSSIAAGETPKPPRGAALPPGPRLPALVQSILLLRFRHSYLPWLHRRYGDVIGLRLLPENRPLVLFARPEHAKEIFAGDPEVFHAGRGNAILGPIMGHRSVLLQDSLDHKRARTLLMPAFNGQALRGYRTLVADLAEAESASWPPGREFAAHERMNALTLEIILQVVFGVTDPERLEQMRPRVLATINFNPMLMVGWAAPGLRRLGPWRRMRLNQIALDRLIHAEIAERRAAGDLHERTDVLSRLLQVAADADVLDGEQPMTDAELRDQLITLLLAGHETTASALSWALYEIGTDPALRARAEAAADGGGEGDALLEAILKESMRRHTVISMVNRTLMEPTTVAGIDLPAGTTVSPSILLVHGSERWHEVAGGFDPDRFLGHSPAPNTWFPFGGGARRCLGAGFSLMEGVEILRAVLRRHHVEAVRPEEPKVRNITSVPRHGVPLRVLAR